MWFLFSYCAVITIMQNVEDAQDVEVTHHMYVMCNFYIFNHRHATISCYINIYSTTDTVMDLPLPIALYNLSRTTYYL